MAKLLTKKGKEAKGKLAGRDHQETGCPCREYLLLSQMPMITKFLRVTNKWTNLESKNKIEYSLPQTYFPPPT